MDGKKESLLREYPKVIPYECSKKIVEQMEKNICRINTLENQGTGFFTKIPFPKKDKVLPVFITNNHIIDNNLLKLKDAKIKIDLKEETEIKEIKLKDRIVYTNEEYDITIIEIKENDNIKNFLELDDIIINDILNDNNKNKEFMNDTIYIIQYCENKLSVSYGILYDICIDKKYNFQHKCNTKEGSSGSAILNINNKLIGIHKEGCLKNQFNIGIFLNYPIKDFIKINCNRNKKRSKSEGQRILPLKKFQYRKYSYDFNSKREKFEINKSDDNKNSLHINNQNQKLREKFKGINCKIKKYYNIYVPSKKIDKETELRQKHMVKNSRSSSANRSYEKSEHNLKKKNKIKNENKNKNILNNIKPINNNKNNLINDNGRNNKNLQQQNYTCMNSMSNSNRFVP